MADPRVDKRLDKSPYTSYPVRLKKSHWKSGDFIWIKLVSNNLAILEVSLDVEENHMLRKFIDNEIADIEFNASMLIPSQIIVIETSKGN